METVIYILADGNPAVFQEGDPLPEGAFLSWEDFYQVHPEHRPVEVDPVRALELSRAFGRIGE